MGEHSISSSPSPRTPQQCCNDGNKQEPHRWCAHVQHHFPSFAMQTTYSHAPPWHDDCCVRAQVRLRAEPPNPLPVRGHLTNPSGLYVPHNQLDTTAGAKRTFAHAVAVSNDIKKNQCSLDARRYGAIICRGLKLERRLVRRLLFGRRRVFSQDWWLVSVFRRGTTRKTRNA